MEACRPNPFYDAIASTTALTKALLSSKAFLCMWYARSDEFLQQGFLETLRWIRTFGDVVFIVGAVSIAWQVLIAVFASKGQDMPPQSAKAQSVA